MKKPLAIVISLLLLGVPAERALAGNTLDEVKRRGILVAGVKSASPPFGFVDRSTGALAGDDVDFVKAIAARLGVKAVLTPVTAAMERKRRQEQADFEKLKMQLDYAYDNWYYGWYGYPW